MIAIALNIILSPIPAAKFYAGEQLLEIPTLAGHSIPVERETRHSYPALFVLHVMFAIDLARHGQVSFDDYAHGIFSLVT
jgi:hypothetical protein